MSVTLKTQPGNKTDNGGETMVTSRTEYLRSIKGGFLNVGKILLQVLKILLIIYLAFFCYVAVHEWAGHILMDELVYASHGTHFEKLDVIVQWIKVIMEGDHWSVGVAPFRIGGEVVSAIPHDIFAFTDWEIGISLLMGSAITTLVSLVALTALNLLKNVQRFPWFTVFFSVSSVIFDQIFETFMNPTDALNGAVLMGADPLLFKIIVIGLVMVQGWLWIRFALRYRRARQMAQRTV
jgi:hypothetical protein